MRVCQKPLLAYRAAFIASRPLRHLLAITVRTLSSGCVFRLYGQRQALNAQVLHGMQPGLFNPAAGNDGATAAAKVNLDVLPAWHGEQKPLALPSSVGMAFVARSP